MNKETKTQLLFDDNTLTPVVYQAYLSNATIALITSPEFQEAKDYPVQLAKIKIMQQNLQKLFIDSAKKT